MDKQTRVKSFEILFENMDYSEALKIVEELITEDSQCEDFHLYRALCFKGLKNFDESLKSFDHSILLNPQKSISFAAKGNLLFDQQNYHSACLSYNQANLINAKVNFYSNENLSFLINEHEKAIKHYETASKQAGFSPDIKTKRKSSLENYEKLKLEKAFD